MTNNIISSRSWCVNGDMTVVVVATEGFAHDWAAYIGAVPSDALPSVALKTVADGGTKLFQDVALGIFPESKDWGMSYRY